MEPFALISDIDNTLLGIDPATARFAAFYHEMKPAMRLSFNSGRFYASQLESVRDTPLPMPDAMVGGVGTDIHFPPQGELLSAWHDHIGQEWNAGTVHQALRGIEGLELQPEEFLSPYKVSYYYFDATPDDIAALEQKLADEGMVAKVVYSSKRDLDILPIRADKGEAARFLAQHWGLPDDRVFVSGDSGNDLALFQQGYRGIVVGNAHEELRALRGDHVYHATGECADGVIEGLRHWLGLA